MFFPLFRQLMGGALMAQLSDSLPPEVKKISLGSALKQRAMSSRAVSTAFFASRPTEYRLDGLP